MSRRAILAFAVFSALQVAYMTAPVRAAAISVDCSYTKDKKTSFCLTNNDGDERLWRCDKNKDGKTWHCGELKSERKITPSLRNAVMSAMKHATKPRP